MKVTIRNAKYLDIPHLIVIQKLAKISNIVRGTSREKINKLVFSNYNDDFNYYEQKLQTLLGYVIEYSDSIIGFGFIADHLTYFEIQSVYI